MTGVFRKRGPALTVLLSVVLLNVSVSVFAAGDDVSTRTTTEQTFEEGVESLRDAILNRGYKVDYHGHISDMLDRTAKDVGATKRIYSGAEIFTFCSAVLSRSVMEHNASDIAYCPYVLFVYEKDRSDEGVTFGFRHLPEGGARDQVNTILTEIIESAAEGF